MRNIKFIAYSDSSCGNLNGHKTGTIVNGILKSEVFMMNAIISGKLSFMFPLYPNLSLKMSVIKKMIVRAKLTTGSTFLPFSVFDTRIL